MNQMPGSSRDDYCQYQVITGDFQSITSDSSRVGDNVDETLISLNKCELRFFDVDGLKYRNAN